MLWRHAAVDNADDDAVTVEAFGTSQAIVGVEEIEKRRAEAERHRAYFIFPDIQDLGEVLELVGLCRTHAGGKTVQAVLIAVDLLDIPAGFG